MPSGLLRRKVFMKGVLYSGFSRGGSPCRNQSHRGSARSTTAMRWRLSCSPCYSATFWAMEKAFSKTVGDMIAVPTDR